MAHESSTPDQPIRLQGLLLLADPGLKDGIFDRSVILMAEHGPETGAYGLILNQPTGRKVGDFLKAEEFSQLRNLAVYNGGPVASDQLTFSSLWWSEKKGLRWAARISAEDAISHSKRPGRIVRAYVGYSGWTPGQLENELRRNSWIALRPPNGMLGLDHDSSLWSGILRQLSPLHRILAEAPDNPSLN